MHCKLFSLAFLLLIFTFPASADVVRPALIEISLYTTGKVVVEVRASVEALLTGINGRYRNTQEAPNAEEYDTYRKMLPGELTKAFEAFKPTFLQGVDLKLDGESLPLTFESVDIPEPGYTKVPRISTLKLVGEASRQHRQLTWYYPMRFGDHATRVRQVDEENQKWHWSDHQWIKKDIYTEPYALDHIFTRQSFLQVFKTYAASGFQHIFPNGMDHILFVLGIFLLSTSLRPLLWQVTMFTIAHSITLSLSMLGLFSLPAQVVEPLVALSIAYVGIENVFKPRLHKSRLWLVFGFGLLHGLGFASILSEFGMPKDDFALALISFNVGIELGQLAIISIAFLAVGVWFRHQQIYRRLVVLPMSIIIGVVGLYWFWQRLEWVS
jgi:hydrogenase/urease accessory protein HupE